MHKINIILLSLICFTSCKPNSENKLDDQIVINYPETLTKIFDAHGGMDSWNNFKGLYFELGEDKYHVNLKERSSLIEYENHKLGYDGENVWLQNLDTITYKSNPNFMYNLMFYFYAMPFVLGDQGINYSEVEPLQFEGKDYPGISISYNSGVGTSPDDEYILYYNSETYQMEWLAYTVTYFSKEKSKEFRFIKYNNWEDISGIRLPKTLQWYKYEGRIPTEKRNDRNFKNAKLSLDAFPEEMFKSPDSTMIIN